MSPLDYGPGWVPPWRHGLEQARCANPACIAEGVPPRLVVAITLDAAGLCVLCARTPASDEDRELRLGIG